MKLLLLLLTLSTSLFAQEDKQLCRYLQENTLALMASELLPEFPSEVIIKTSRELSKKRNLECKSGRLSAILDFDSCSSLCVKNGSSDMAVTMSIYTNGLIGINKVTRECQRMCKAYQMKAFTYRDGLQAR